ncbi:Regulator of G-protein signaling 6 [Turdus rufiventris]|nr:Regulator of G-protein signaling 6 [Turdus rufiventris]
MWHIEDIITRMQDDKTGGVPIRTVKSFLSKIPSVVTGSDIVQWLMKNLSIEDAGEAIHLGSLIAAQGYVFPISDHVLTLKDDGTFYRFQVAIYLCKRTMQNKARLELADYEASVYGVTEESQPQSPVHLPSQPVRKTTKEDFRKQITFLNMQIERHCLKMSKVAESLIAYTEQYVEYDPFITPAEPSNPWISDDAALWDIEMSKEPSQQRVKRWGFSMDEVLKDPVGRDQFLRFLESEFSSENLREVANQWAGTDRLNPGYFVEDIGIILSICELRCYSYGIIMMYRFWLAVQDLKKQPLQDVTTRVEEIWQEFLAPGAQSAINLDSHSYEKTSQNVKDPGRYTYEDAQGAKVLANASFHLIKKPEIEESISHGLWGYGLFLLNSVLHVLSPCDVSMRFDNNSVSFISLIPQEHIYKLMKSDSYARFLRSNAYQDLLLTKKKAGKVRDLGYPTVAIQYFIGAYKKDKRDFLQEHVVVGQERMAHTETKQV